MQDAKTQQRGKSAREGCINALPALCGISGTDSVPRGNAPWEWFFPLWPPSVNCMYQAACGGRRVLKPEVRAFRAAMGAEFMHARALGKMPRERLLGRVGVRLRFFLPDMRTHDLDNLLKCLFDACTKARLWRDDSQVWEMDCRKSEPISRGGGFWLAVWPLAAVPPAELPPEEA